MLKITPNDQRGHLGQQRSVALLYLIVEQEIRLPHLQSTKPVSVRRRQQRKQLVLLCLIIQNLSLFFTAAHTHMLRISTSSLLYRISPGHARSPQRKPVSDSWAAILHAECPSSHLTTFSQHWQNPKASMPTRQNHTLDHIHSGFSNWPVRKGIPDPSRQLSSTILLTPSPYHKKDWLS